MKGYPFDLSKLTLDEFCFHSRSGNWCSDKKGKFRDVVDAIRTVYWFNALRLRMPQEKQTPSKMERELEPDAYKVSEYGVPYHHNKWSNYALGRNTPTAPLVDKADLAREGTRLVFNHVLWDIMRLRLPIVQHAEAWLMRLEPTVQARLWMESATKDLIGRTKRQRLRKADFVFLERRASLDTLACLTLLIRTAHAEGKVDYALEISQWLSRSLLILSEIFQQYGLSRPIYEYYRKNILPLGEKDNFYHSYEPSEFPILSEGLTTALGTLRGVDPNKLTAKQSIHYKHRILSGEYGWDYFFIFHTRKDEKNERALQYFLQPR